MALKLSKFFLALLILYSGYFQSVLFRIPKMLLILGFCTVFFLMMFMYRESTPIRYGFTIEIDMWIAFAISSLFIGYIIVSNKSHLVSSLFVFAQNLLLMIAIIYISKYDENIDYVVNIFIILALLSAITTIFLGEGYHGGNQISLTVDTNPNGLGISLVNGIACLLYKLNLNKKLSITFIFFGILIFLYTIILTGSRKSFLAAILLMIYWFLFCFNGELKKISHVKKVGAIIIILIAISFFIYFMAPIFNDSLLLQRLGNLFEGGDKTRIGMYKEAYQFFKYSPLTGIGYKNYELLSIYGTYSHSTYAEAIACTGLIGFILYFSSYMTIAKKTTMIIFNKYINQDIRIQANIILGIFITMLFLGTGIIHFYQFDSYIVFAMIISFNGLNHIGKKRKLVINEEN